MEIRLEVPSTEGQLGRGGLGIWIPLKAFLKEPSTCYRDSKAIEIQRKLPGSITAEVSDGARRKLWVTVVVSASPRT